MQMELATMRMRKSLISWICFLFIGFYQISKSNGYYLPGGFVPTYANVDPIYAKVNSLTSSETELPFSYYSLPYCQPLDGIKKSAESLGELFTAGRIDNSPYHFNMNKNQSSYLCTTAPLNEHEVKLFKQRIRGLYQVNMILDNLPVMRFENQNGVKIQSTGFPIGFTSSDGNVDYVINHLKFTVLVREGNDIEIVDGMGAIWSQSGFEIVGFHVVPCSVKRDPEVMTKLHMYDNISSINCPNESDKYQPIREQERISFTYEVEFVKSDIKWPSRWDAYLKMEGSRVYWFSILNSLMVIFVLAGIVSVIFSRRVRRDLARYEELDKETQAQMNAELFGWKLVVGDVFREPGYTMLLCAMVGNGIQILGMVVITIIFAVLGFMSPTSRGDLISCMFTLYIFVGYPSGSVTVHLWRTIKGKSEGWFLISLFSACFFPGIALTILTALNFVLWVSNSTNALPFSLFFKVFFTLFCLTAYFTLGGGYGYADAKCGEDIDIEYPVQTNQIPREIPARKYPSWLLVLGAGIVPFGILFIELFFILSSIWHEKFYYVFGFLSVVLLLLIIVCAVLSVVLTYMHLCDEDWRWWWKSFFASGSVALYVFLYSIKYLVFDLQSLSGPVSAILYIGYSLLMAIAIMLMTGSVGFLVSYNFVHYLFSSVKID